MEPSFSVLVVGGSANDSAIRICREMIFKYGIRVINTDYYDASDYILYGVEEYYRSSDIRTDKWVSNFGSHVDLINARRQNFEHVDINTQDWAGILDRVDAVINLMHYYEPRLGGLLTTPIIEVEQLIDLWCHMIDVMEVIRFGTDRTIIYLINEDDNFNRGLGVLASSTAQFLDGKLSACRDHYDVYFTTSELFQQFENGTYADIMR
ncbi:unnamed protein product [Kluyveromyces dobzhanskii CBS 2104]|uniref:WGS project CCBQ000000000 data, contig 00015 n=1 Tax=Kluyveromyces dobzhanskii CBS 2104 TaxID=1427455 RepID=A0A0A8LC19_9SACH|nr:unnamed protein product [Kluyveromyces dobzhanskii CBS 2104]